MADKNNIKPTEQYRSAIAERGKFWPVDDDYLESLNYPASGNGKYAVLTYQVNSAPITLSGDVQMGSVEISDADTDDRVNIALDDTKYAMFVQSESLATEATLSGVESTLEALSGLVDGVTQTPDSPQAPNVIQMGGISETTVPAGVGDGDAVAVWYDEFGRQVIAGYNPTIGAINVTQINEALLNRIGPIELHNAANTDDESPIVNVNPYNKIKIQVQGIASTDLQFAIMHRIHPDLEWYTVRDIHLTTVGTETTEISLADEAWGEIQTTVTSVSGGNATAYLIAGN